MWDDEEQDVRLTWLTIDTSSRIPFVVEIYESSSIAWMILIFFDLKILFISLV